MENAEIEFVVWLNIGKYTISQYSDGKMWINEDGGEGMPINEPKFYEVVDKFYLDNFK